MSSLYVLVTGFGLPHWDHKVSILKKNLHTIHQHPWKNIKITICQYTPRETHCIPKELIEQYNLNIIYEPGIVGEFMYHYAKPEVIAEYDYILTILDDIELLSFHWGKALQYINDFDLDILSPSLSRDSKFQYPYMLQDTDNNYSLKITTCCEYFCFLAKTTKFKKYYQHLDLENPWMWGIDLILRKHAGLTVAVLNCMVMKHWYKNESYSTALANPVKGFEKCMLKYNENADDLAKQIPIVYIIFDPMVVFK